MNSLHPTRTRAVTHAGTGLMSAVNERDSSLRIRVASRACAMLALATAAGAGPGDAAAQTTPPRTVPDQISCRPCSIDVRRILTLGAGTGDSAFNVIPLAMAIDGLERFWVVGGSELPRVYDGRGKFLGFVGTKGRGPGEFVEPIDVVPLPGDSVLVIDGAQLRATVVDNHLKPNRSIRLPFGPRPSAVMQWPGNVWANGLVPTPTAAGWPLHRLSLTESEARLLASFGPDAGELRPEMGSALAQLVSAGRNNVVWTADKFMFRLVAWTGTGQQRAALERKPDWFSVRSRPWIGNTTNPPPPLIAGVQEDESGLVWVFVNVPSPSWRNAWTQVAASAREVSSRAIAIEHLYHTIIEVLDPKEQRVIARRELNEWVKMLLPGGRAAVAFVDREGVPHVTVVAYRLVGRE